MKNFDFNKIYELILNIYLNLFNTLDKSYLWLKDTFNNRELAMGIIIIIIILFALSKKEIRKSIKEIIKTLFNKKLIFINIILISYFLVMILILDKVGFWENRLWKDAIIWFLFTAIVYVVNSIGQAKDFNYFRSSINDNIKIFIVLEFILNMYTFSLIGEIVLTIVLSFISISIVLCESIEDINTNGSKILINILKWIQTLIVILVLARSIKLISMNTQNILLYDLLKDILLPLILMMMFIPYVYLLVLYSTYEIIFIRLKFKKTINDNIRWYLNLRILLICRLNINRINDFTKKSTILYTNIKTISDVNELIFNYKRSIKHKLIN